MSEYRLWLKLQISEVRIEDLTEIKRMLNKVFDDQVWIEEIEMKKDKIRV